MDKRYTQEDIASWPEGHRRCTKCHEVLPFGRFHKHKTCLFGINTVCKTCRLPASKKNYDNMSMEYRLWNAAKWRAKKFGIPFTITIDDIMIPETCPVLGIPLVRGEGRAVDSSPSLDQRSPRAGYTPENIVVISWRANWLKNNANLDELEKLIDWMKK